MNIFINTLIYHLPQAQKQVFNLMKFDSYSRFLKSSVYQECLDRENRGEGLQFSASQELDPNLRIEPLPSSVSADSSNVRSNSCTYDSVSNISSNFSSKLNIGNLQLELAALQNSNKTSTPKTSQPLRCKMRDSVHVGVGRKSENSVTNETVIEGKSSEEVHGCHIIAKHPSVTTLGAANGDSPEKTAEKSSNLTNADSSSIKIRNEKGRQLKKDCSEDIKLVSRVADRRSVFSMSDPSTFMKYLEEAFEHKNRKVSESSSPRSPPCITISPVGSSHPPEFSEDKTGTRTSLTSYQSEKKGHARSASSDNIISNLFVPTPLSGKQSKSVETGLAYDSLGLCVVDADLTRKLMESNNTPPPSKRKLHPQHAKLTKHPSGSLDTLFAVAKCAPEHHSMSSSSIFSRFFSSFRRDKKSQESISSAAPSPSLDTPKSRPKSFIHGNPRKHSFFSEDSDHWTSTETRQDRKLLSSRRKKHSKAHPVAENTEEKGADRERKGSVCPYLTTLEREKTSQAKKTYDVGGKLPEWL